jgi:predicted nucleic acid-binding Zn ribbon protein
MPYTGNEITLREAIEAMLKEYGLEERIVQAHISSSWEKLMGKTINIRTQEVKLKNRKLYIKVNSSVLREELHYARNKILEIINAEFKNPVADEIVLL